jgi:NTE family protein
VIRPSRDIGKLANRFEDKLPRMFRYLMRRFGSRETNDQDFISTVMFQRDYIAELLALGELDATQQMDHIEAQLR